MDLHQIKKGTEGASQDILGRQRNGRDYPTQNYIGVGGGWKFPRELGAKVLECLVWCKIHFLVFRFFFFSFFFYVPFAESRPQHISRWAAVFLFPINKSV